MTIHLLFVAALLLVAFLVGACVGTLARLVALRLKRKPAAAIAAQPEAVVAAAPLVAAPVIAPLPVAPTPTPLAPADVPVPDFAATLIALANETPPPEFVAAKARPEPAIAVVPEPIPAARPRLVAAGPAMQPARVAGQTTSGIVVAAPKHENPPEVPVAPAIANAARSADVIQFPSVTAEPTPSSVVVGGETVTVVDTSELLEPEAEQPPLAAVTTWVEPIPSPDRAHEDNFLFVTAAAPATIEAEVVPEPEPKQVEKPVRAEAIPIPAITPNASVSAVLAADLAAPEIIETRTAPESVSRVAATPPSEPVADEPVVAEAVAPVPAEEAADTPAIEPAPAVDAPAPVAASAEEPIDEDAAMRAIEGNWTPRRTPPKRPARAVDAPEGANQAVAASARAVTAARRVAEAVVAEVAEIKIEAGRPVGLSGPRDGRKDDLTHIIGVLPVIETALNSLGIYHFDQMGELSDENIGWIEGHLGVPGRISRELWREQARELSAVLRPKRAAEN